MRITEKHIRHFNLINGNTVSKRGLQKFHDKIEKDFASKRIDLHMPGGVECEDIKNRLAKAIQKMNSRQLVRVEFKPVKFNPQPSFAQKHIQKIKSQDERMPDEIRAMLYGLETSCPDGEQFEGLGFTREGQQKIYDMVTSMILEAMKADKLFWRKPWEGGGKKSTKVKVNVMGPQPVNFVSKTPYSGVNYWLLKYVAPGQGGYEVLNYVTINQVKQLGGSIKKGAKPWPVIYYSMIYKHNGKTITEDQYYLLSKEERQKNAQKIPFIQYYKVFNAQDVEGVPGIMEQVQARKTVLQYDVEPIKAAETIVNNMPNRPHIEHSKQRRAYYMQSGDFVHMPFIGLFDQEQEYYSTYFHELVHSTGHSKRLGRELSQEKKKYAFEELIAELGASYLCAESGILYFTLKNSAAYLKSWSKSLREEMEADSKFFLKAAAKAQQASDFILDFNQQKTKVEEAPKSKRESKSTRPPVERKERGKATAEHSKNAALSGLSRATDLAGINFYQHDLGPFKKDFHRINSDSNVMIWGKPGHGKTVKLLQFAQHLATTGKRVLYISNEEYGKSTLAEKINEFKIGHDNLYFAGTLDEIDLNNFEVIFFDSINSMGLTSHDVKALDRKHPNKLFVLVVQTTKEGDFRGGKDWEHLVDIAGEVRNRKMILRKNRLDANFKEKAEKILVDEMVKEKLHESKIKQLVKEQTEPAEPGTT